MKQKQKNIFRVVGLLAWLMTIQIGWSFYNPQTGHWLNRDPIQESGGPNLYSFVSNEPLSARDSKGLKSNGNDLNLTSFSELQSIGDCGAVVQRSTWGLNGADGHADPSVGGIIVQHVSLSFNVQSCCPNSQGPVHTGPPAVSPIDPGYWPFYEAWTISPGRNRPGPGWHDFWQMPSSGVGTQGTIIITGQADYFDGEILPWYFFPHHAGPPNNSLPTSPLFDPPGAPTSSVTRTLTISWNCCCHSEKSKVTPN